MKIIRYALLVGCGLFIDATIPTTGKCMEAYAGAQPSLEEEMAALEASGYTETLVGVTQAEDHEEMERLLANHADANELVEGLRPLWWAVFNHDLEAIAKLRRAGAKPGLHGNTDTHVTSLEYAQQLLADARIMQPHMVAIRQAVVNALTEPL